MAIRLGVLLSGNGTTLQNLIDRIADGRLDAQIAIVISNVPDAFGLVRAERACIPFSTVPSRGRPTDEYSAIMFEQLRAAEVDLVVLAGFMRQLSIPEDFAGRVMNVHPSLIPAFAGKGFFGHHVHQAVIDRGCKLTGCTVHFADPHYDEGPIILQRAVIVEDDDTAATLAARVQAAESEAYPEAIALFAAGRLRIDGRRVRILPED